MADIQLNEDGSLRHFLSIEGLSSQMLTQILNTAEALRSASEMQVRKMPLLRGKTVVNLFFEPSTRTRTTFELAAKRLSADVVNVNIAASSATKGESLLDTLRTLEAMHCDMMVVRHSDSGAAQFFATHAARHVSILNAGDGQHSHPTQAMLDAFTIRRHRPDFQDLKVLIVGDILHSRVARSQIHALNMLNARQVRIAAPPTLLPPDADTMGVHVFTDLDEAIRDVDIVIMLRLQKERMQGAYLPSSHEYFSRYGLTQERLKLASPGCLVMHPGPMNRGVEIESSIADGPRSLILEQVSNGLFVRMAVMAMVMGAHQGLNQGISGP